MVDDPARDTCASLCAQLDFLGLHMEHMSFYIGSNLDIL